MQGDEKIEQKQLEEIIVFLDCLNEIITELNEYIESIPIINEKTNVTDFWNTSAKKDLYISILYFIQEFISKLKKQYK